MPSAPPPETAPVTVPNRGEPPGLPGVPFPATPPWLEPPLPGRGGAPLGAWTVESNRVSGNCQYLVGAGSRIPILYGRCLIVPDLVDARSGTYSGTSHGEFVAVISEGPIEGIESWWATGEGGLPVGQITANELISGPGNGYSGYYASIASRLGTLSQTAVSGLVGPLPGVAHAYVVTTYRYATLPGMMVKGRKLYDHRLGAWGAGEYPDDAKCQYDRASHSVSANPSCQMADLLTNTQYGLGISPTLIDWTAFDAFADYCDETVNGNKRYECHIYIRDTRTVWEWMETIGSHAGGARVREVDGLWTVDWTRAVSTVDATIRYEDVVAGSRPRVTFGGGAGLADLPNRFVAEWTDASPSYGGWQVRQVVINHAEVDAGAAVRESTVYKLHGCQKEDQAYRCLWQIAYRVWSDVTIELDLPARFLHLKVGSRVTLVMPEIGYASQDFLVTNATYTGAGIRISAFLYDPNIWTPATPGTSDPPADDFFGTPEDLTATLSSEVISTPVFDPNGLAYEMPATKTYFALNYETVTWPYARDIVIHAAADVILRAVQSFTITDGGSGHTAGQTVYVWSGGWVAVGTVATVSGGAVTGITVTNTDKLFTDAISEQAVRVGAVDEWGIVANCTPPSPDDIWAAAGLTEIVPLNGNRVPTTGEQRLAVNPGILLDETYGGLGGGGSLAHWIAVRVRSLAGVLSPGITFWQDSSHIDLPGTAGNGRNLLVEGDGTGTFPDMPLTAGAIPVAVGNSLLKDSKFTDDGTTPKYNTNKLWHEGNDGAASGLDADKLDGQEGSYYAPLASPAFTGSPTAPTRSAGDNSTKLATTAYVDAAVAAGGGGGKVLKAQEFTSGTTNWTAPTGVTEVWVTGCAGGGGGGRGQSSSLGAGGGGAGGDSVFRKKLTVTAGNTYSVVIGAGGAGGTGSNGNSGLTGGSTSFGALLTLSGGGGGISSASAAGGRGGNAGSGGQNGFDGQPYVATYAPTPAGGNGGLSFPGGWGSGGPGRFNGNGITGQGGYLLVEWNG